MRSRSGHNQAIPAASFRGERAALLSSYFVDVRELWLLTGVLPLYLITMGYLDAASKYWVNALGPSAMLTVLALGAWWQLRREPRAIWIPLFWFRIATSVYFGVGQIAPYLANDVTLLYIHSLYSFNDDEAFKVGLINVVSVLTVLATAAVLERSRLFRQTPAVVAPQSRTFFYAFVFLVAGGVAKYLIVLPGTLGMTEFSSGIVQSLAKSYAVGLFLLTLMALRGSRAAGMAVAILAPIDIAVGFLTFAKTEVLLPLLFIFLALLHDRLTVWRLMASAVMIVGVFSQLDPYIHFGRDEVWRQYKDAGVPLERRLGIIRQFNGKLSDDPEIAERQSALNRVSYLNAAAMVTRYYDTGNAGSSLKYALVVLIPRAIWPDKPEITRVGKDLYLQATFREGSSISPGLFAEAYWNFGWTGIPILMVPLGMIFWLFSRYSLGVMRREAWVHLPVVLLGVVAGVRVDGWYVADIIGGCSVALLLAILFNFVERLSGQSGRGAPRS